MASIVEDTVVNYELAKTNYNHLGQPLDTLLKITIHSASGLKDVDFMGKSDPYVTLQKFNGCVIQGPWSKKELPACGTARGRVIKDNCDPIFEEDYYFLMEEKVTRCKLVIKDEDIGTDASIGTQILNFHSGMEGGEEIKVEVDPAGDVEWPDHRSTVRCFYLDLLQDHDVLLASVP